MGASRVKWTPERIEEFRQLRAWVGPRAAARRLGISYGAAAGMAHRLDREDGIFIDREPRDREPRDNVLTASVTVPMEPCMREALVRRAKADGCAVSAKVREYIEWGLEAEGHDD